MTEVASKLVGCHYGERVDDGYYYTALVIGGSGSVPRRGKVNTQQTPTNKQKHEMEASVMSWRAVVSPCHNIVKYVRVCVFLCLLHSEDL